MESKRISQAVTGLVRSDGVKYNLYSQVKMFTAYIENRH